MNTVVLYVCTGGYLGRTFECSNDDEIRLAANLICQDLGIDLLTDEEFNELLFDYEIHVERLCSECSSAWESGNIYIGGLEAIS